MEQNDKKAANANVECGCKMLSENENIVGDVSASMPSEDELIEMAELFKVFVIFAVE